MRFLATQHVYKEIKPEVFTNTRLSSVLDTGKSVDEILAKYVSRNLPLTLGAYALWVDANLAQAQNMTTHTASPHFWGISE